MGLQYSIESQVLTRHGSALCRIGSASMQGYRAEMEDDHTCFPSLPSHPTTTVLGVYDGHGGDTASAFLAARWPNLLNGVPNPHDAATLKARLLTVDAEFLQTQFPAHGSTFVSAIVSPDPEQPSWQRKVTVAHAGDSRCLWIGADGSCRWATTDHKPDDPAEKARIEAAGGFVQRGRVNGSLAVARAVGDAMFKAYAMHVCVCLPDPPDGVGLEWLGGFSFRFSCLLVLAWSCACACVIGCIITLVLMAGA